MDMQIYKIKKIIKTQNSSCLGGYHNLEEAKKKCPMGYGVFDEDGVIVYAPFPIEGDKWSELKEYLEEMEKSLDDKINRLGDKNTNNLVPYVNYLSEKKVVLLILRKIKQLEGDNNE